VIVPDPRVAETGEPQSDHMQRVAGTVAEPVVSTTLIEEEIHEARLEVIDRAGRVVVTVIEVPSPANKVAGSRGRESYEEKRREVMTSPSYFVEIDLLRDGVPIQARQALPRGD